MNGSEKMINKEIWKIKNNHLKTCMSGEASIVLALAKNEWMDCMVIHFIDLGPSLFRPQARTVSMAKQAEVKLNHLEN